MCSTVLEAKFDITPSLRSWQVEPSKGRSTQSCVCLKEIYCQCFSGGGRGMMGKFLTISSVCGEKWTAGTNQTHTALECSWQHITASRPTAPMFLCFFFFFFFFFIFSKTPPFLYFLLLYLFSLPPLWLLCMFLFLLQQTAVPAISVLDLVCSLRSLSLFLFRLHLCLLLFTTSPLHSAMVAPLPMGIILREMYHFFQAGNSILGCSLCSTGKLLLWNNV